MALRHIFFPTWHRSAQPAQSLPESALRIGLGARPAAQVWALRFGRITLTLGLLFCAAAVARRGVAEWFYDQQTLDGMRRAMRWDPANARYYLALADALDNSPLEGNVSEAVRLGEEAARLAPLDARGWARLGAVYEAAGRVTDAGQAYERAVQLFPRSPELNWRLGNFLLRQDDNPRALSAFRKVVAGSPAMRCAAYQTAWGATDNSREILEEMIPPQSEMLTEYLNYLLDTRRLDAAREAWWRIADGGFFVSTEEALRYLDVVLSEQRGDDAIAAWEALSARAPNLYATHHRQGNRVTNGGFEFNPLRGGLDWRIATVEGATARIIDSGAYEGQRCLEVAFAGTHNLEYSHVFELVPVEPSTRYLFLARVRARDLSSDSAPRFLLRDTRDEHDLRVETSAVPATTEWTELRLEFRTSATTRLIDLRLFRPRSRKFNGIIGGTLWVDDVRMLAQLPEPQDLQHRSVP